MILSLCKFFDVQNWAVMNENQSQQSEQIKLSDQEIEHALTLRKNPILANN